MLVLLRVSRFRSSLWWWVVWGLSPILVLYYFCMYLCDDDICTDADIDEAVASDDIIENIMDNFVTITPASGVASYSLTDDDLELVAESM